MKPPVQNIRISQRGKEALQRLKNRTGIPNWNVLCRWAVSASLAMETPPPRWNAQEESNIDMDWKTFAGGHQEVYWALLVQRVHDDGLPTDNETLTREFYRHLHRGLGLLANLSQKPTIRNLMSLVA